MIELKHIFQSDFGIPNGYWRKTAFHNNLKKKKTYFFIYFADLFTWTEHKLYWATTGGPNNFLYCSNDTNIWDVFWSLGEKKYTIKI